MESFLVFGQDVAELPSGDVVGQRRQQGGTIRESVTRPQITRVLGAQDEFLDHVRLVADENSARGQIGGGDGDEHLLVDNEMDVLGALFGARAFLPWLEWRTRRRFQAARSNG